MATRKFESGYSKLQKRKKRRVELFIRITKRGFKYMIIYWILMA